MVDMPGVLAGMMASAHQMSMIAARDMNTFQGRLMPMRLPAMLDNNEKTTNVEFAQKFTMDNSKKIGKGSFGVIYKARLTAVPGPNTHAVKVFRKSLTPLKEPPRTPDLPVIPHAAAFNRDVLFLGHKKGTPDHWAECALEIVREARLLRTLDALGAAPGGRGNKARLAIASEIFEDIYMLYIVQDRLKISLLEAFNNQYFKKPGDVRHVMKQVLEGLDWMHAHNYVHLDLKLENVMLTTNNEVKIIDFGMSRRIQDVPLTWWGGTGGYWAPELFDKTKPASGRSDIWSAGCLMYVITNGAYAFRDTVPGKYNERIPAVVTKRNYPCAIRALRHNHMAEVIQGMLVEDFRNRKSGQQLLAMAFFAVNVGDHAEKGVLMAGGIPRFLDAGYDSEEEERAAGGGGGYESSDDDGYDSHDDVPRWGVRDGRHVLVKLGRRHAQQKQYDGHMPDIPDHYEIGHAEPDVPPDHPVYRDHLELIDEHFALVRKYKTLLNAVHRARAVAGC